MSRANHLPLVRLLGVLAVCSTAQSLTFSEWQSTRFSPGQLADQAFIAPSADPDGDGLSNLAEYVFTGDPVLADAGLAPQSGQSGSHLTLTYRERSDLSGTEVWLQGGDDLSHWATFNTLEEIARVNGTGYSDITLRDPFPINPKRFLRLRLLLTPLPPLQSPANLGLTVENRLRAELRWTDLNVSEIGYAVEKLDPVTQTWVRKATLQPDTISWVDNQLAGYDGTSYRVVTLGALEELPSSSFALADASLQQAPDWWTQYYFSGQTYSATGDANGNGVSNWDEFLEGTDPTWDYFQGAHPIITIISGDNQTQRSGQFMPAPLVARVTDSQGNPFVGAPVRFTATPEEGLLCVDNLGSGGLRPALTVYTDSSGYAQVWLKCP